MLSAATLWSALSDSEARYFYGTPIAGLPHLLVKHVPCSHCKSRPGQLCTGTSGHPTLGHHIARGAAWRSFKRSHPIDPPSNSRLHQLELRVAALERLIGINPQATP